MQSRFANIANFALDAEVHRPRYREKCDAQAAELRTLRQQLDERDSELIEEVPSAFSLPKFNATGEVQKGCNSGRSRQERSNSIAALQLQQPLAGDSSEKFLVGTAKNRGRRA